MNWKISAYRYIVRFKMERPRVPQAKYMKGIWYSIAWKINTFHSHSYFFCIIYMLLVRLWLRLLVLFHCILRRFALWYFCAFCLGHPIIITSHHLNDWLSFAYILFPMRNERMYKFCLLHFCFVIIGEILVSYKVIWLDYWWRPKSSCYDCVTITHKNDQCIV